MSSNNPYWNAQSAMDNTQSGFGGKQTTPPLQILFRIDFWCSVTISKEELITDENGDFSTGMTVPT
jgi:hypothetical protein